MIAKKVDSIFHDCLFRDKELRDGSPIYPPVIAEGVVLKCGFNPYRLIEHNAEIDDILNNMHPEFKKGWSFLNLAYDKDGDQWTGMHRTMDKLLCLGLATKKISYCLPREFWGIFPASMPYIIIK